uniref:Uncharacterized protein n=1 Tax=Knipowitschia caucasica TaxID=637954 RepID=A0AAV2LNN5_KNICA
MNSASDGDTGGGLGVSAATIYRPRVGRLCLLAEKVWSHAKFSIRQPRKVTPVCSPCAKRPGLRLSFGELRRGHQPIESRTKRGSSVGQSPAHLGCAPQPAGARGH